MPHLTQDFKPDQSFSIERVQFVFASNNNFFSLLLNVKSSISVVTPLNCYIMLTLLKKIQFQALLKIHILNRIHKMSGKGFVFLLFRCIYIPAAGPSCRSGADTRGETMAGEECGPFPNGVVEAYQPRGRHIVLFGVSKQGKANFMWKSE